MLQKELTIVNKLGLHARAAAKLVRSASAFASQIQIRRDNQTVNAKSIMGVMLLAAAKGTRIELQINGDDSQEALQVLSELIQSGFGEDE
ncbi:HPr family phosphocarrier protein [Candidatus Venteria ishoeyi]|nr:HPr family phosphocarrier protein [Candidatus Venteria ishoeyi]MDM8548267.1 HPr family phosphocarrier protein [Candidatus Venteria ishoeyi]